ncbi:MAG: ExbD/TolR family protein [Opitutales bacterium]
MHEHNLAKEMNKILKPLCIACALIVFSNLQGEEIEKSLLVSVARITSAEQSSSDLVQIEFIVHEPSKIRGTRFHTNCASMNRSEVRTEYPLSKLLRVSASTILFNKLKEQKEEIESDQSIIDRGIDPSRISNLINSPEVDFNLFEESISADKAHVGSKQEPTALEEKKAFEVSISTEGLSVHGNPIAKKELVKTLSELPDNTKILIRAEQTVSHREVISVLEVCNDAGLKNVAIATTQAKQDAS